MTHLKKKRIKSFPDYRHLLQENYCTWNTNIYFFSKCNSRSFFYNTSVHFNICSFCCTENVYSITNFSPRVPQHVFSYCSKSVCYSCLQICNIWNWCRKHFVFNIPPLKEVKGGGYPAIVVARVSDHLSQSTYL